MQTATFQPRGLAAARLQHRQNASASSALVAPAARLSAQPLRLAQAPRIAAARRRPCSQPPRADASSVAAGNAAAAAAAAEAERLLDVSDIARQNLKKAANACRRYGWISFWVQLVLNTVAAIVLLFSLAFTSQNGPGVSLYLTLFGIVLGFLSMFWSFGYVRLSRKLKAFLAASSMETAPKIRRSDVIGMLEKGAIINVLGAGATMLGLSATIGILLAKTLTSATVNPFLATSSSTWNPVLAFDVFNVQATTNALLSHFFSLVCSLWLLRIIANRPSAAQLMTQPASSSPATA